MKEDAVIKGEVTQSGWLYVCGQLKWQNFFFKGIPVMGVQELNDVLIICFDNRRGSASPKGEVVRSLCQEEFRVSRKRDHLRYRLKSGGDSVTVWTVSTSERRNVGKEVNESPVVCLRTGGREIDE